MPSTTPKTATRAERWEALKAKHGVGVSHGPVQWTAEEAALAEEWDRRDRYCDRDAVETWPAGGFV